MKIFYVECDAEEMKSNRTIMDVLSDAVHSMVDAFNSPVTYVSDDDMDEDESEECEDGE